MNGLGLDPPKAILGTRIWVQAVYWEIRCGSGEDRKSGETKRAFRGRTAVGNGGSVLLANL